MKESWIGVMKDKQKERKGKEKGRGERRSRLGKDDNDLLSLVIIHGWHGSLFHDMETHDLTHVWLIAGGGPTRGGLSHR